MSLIDLLLSSLDNININTALTRPTVSLRQHGLGQGRMLRYRMLVLVLTFFTYASFHMSRKAPSIVKGALHPHVESSNYKTAWNPETNPGWLPFSADLNPKEVESHGYTVDLSEVCEVNSDNGAGIYSCLNHSHDVAKNYYNLSYCANFGSENGKFHLRIIDHTDTPKIIGLCVKHGAKNGTDGCWVINGNYDQLSDNERKHLCTQNGIENHDCTMYVQPSGHLIPAPADDKVGWIDVNDGDSNNQTRIGIDVAPAGLTNGKVLLGSLDTVSIQSDAGAM